MIIEERRRAWEYRGETYVRMSYVILEKTLNQFGRASYHVVNGASVQFLDFLNSANIKGLDPQLEYLCEYRRERNE